MTLTDGDYRVYMVSLPGSIGGAVRIDADGFASVYINDNLSRPARRESCDHELNHIRRDDMYSTCDIRTVEGAA